MDECLTRLASDFNSFSLCHSDPSTLQSPWAPGDASALGPLCFRGEPVNELRQLEFKPWYEWDPVKDIREKLSAEKQAELRHTLWSQGDDEWQSL